MEEPISSSPSTSPTVAPEPTQASQSRHSGSLIGGAIILVLGLILLLQNYFPNINMRVFGPVVLIIVGGGMLLRTMRR